MAEYLVWSGSGVTQWELSTAYALGDRVVVNVASAGTNYLVARRYVWECTTAGTTDSVYPTYATSYTPDSSTITSNTAVFTCRNPGYSSGSTKNWTFATPFLCYAHRSAATDGDTIKVHKTHSEAWASDVSINHGPVASISVLCVDKDAGEVLAIMDHTTYWIGTQGSFYFSIIPGGTARRLYYYGIAFKVADGSASSAESFNLAGSFSNEATMESCYIWLAATGAGGKIQVAGNGTGVYSVYGKLKNCTLRFGNTAQDLTVGEGRADFEGCVISSDGSSPAILLDDDNIAGSKASFNGCDLSHATALVNVMSGGHHLFEFVNSKLPASIWSTATSTVEHRGGGEAFVFNCASGDTHYNFGYYNNLGSVEAVTSIYANDGALYDGTNHVTWKITTTAYCDSIRVFETPWIDKYHSATAAITPFLEILRDGSTTAYQDDEVWGEFSYQGTTGSTRATLVNDGMSMLGTPADQAAGVGLSGWTGEAASAWSGKLSPASAITPAEIGFLRARVCVAAPSIEVYVDPKIRT